MQGTFREIDLFSILKLIEFGQRTGELLIQSYSKKFSEKSWFIFFLNGNIVYATSTEAHRLREYLQGINLHHTLDQVNPANFGSNLIEYGKIWALLEANLLTPDQAIKIVHNMVYEVLADLISLHDGTFVFDTAIALSPQLTSIKFDLIAEDIIKQTQHWKNLYQVIQSLDQCPTLIPSSSLTDSLTDRTFKLNIFQWIDGKTSIRQLARYSNQSPLEIATIVYFEVQQGNMAIAPAIIRTNQPLARGLRITCIDDSTTICRAVEYILHSNGYQVTSISNPVRALSLVFQLKPNLIFCDITMPELDGYELCAMFRKSVAFSQIPIIMLTGKDGFIDRIKARMVGATEYLTKPFKEKELLTIVERYLGSSKSIVNKLSTKLNR
jgi:twitching motility two-component system response regulator PilG